MKDGRTVDLLIGPLGGEGRRFARRLHAGRPNLRLLCTGDHEEQSPVAWPAPEHRTCVHKPFALSALIHAARKLLDA
jgi:hypothetical protein